MNPPPVEVHALLVCRAAKVGPSGNVSIDDVLEILPVESLPGDVGPLTFLALVRNVPGGKGEGAFVVSAQGPTPRLVARCRIEVDVPAGYEGRQVALQARLPSLPMTRGGWYEVAFEWQGKRLAANRFAVGTRRAPPEAPPTP